MTRRSEYLETIWKNRFPQARPGVAGFHRGRVIGLSDTRMTLQAGGLLVTVSISSDFELEQSYLVSDVLRPGDLVEVAHEDLSVREVVLLVPSAGDDPFSHGRFDRHRAAQWQAFTGAVRDFFRRKEFFELRTPTLVPSPGLEPFLDPFVTKLEIGRKLKDLFLPTSPEFHLKKALTMGFDRCFEFKECFRNGEMGPTHQPEFLMLEWYRAYANVYLLIEDIRELCAELGRVFKPPLSSDLKVIDMPELWKLHTGFELRPDSTREELAEVAARHGIDPAVDDDFDDLFARIFLQVIEVKLAEMKEPVIVRYYPPSQAALARITNEGWADRFEFYWAGLEIANAFHELNDSREQRRRFAADQDKKRKLGKTVVPVDEEFLKALDWGMPPSAGIALGMDRLFMALTGIGEISETRLFPMRG